MQFTKPFKQRIAKGEITSSFRQWRKPQAKVGGQYNIPPFGAIEVIALRETNLATATQRQISTTGFRSAEALAEYLSVDLNTTLFEVSFRYLGEQDVNKPSTEQLDEAALTKLRSKLKRMDADAPWIELALTLIAKQPGTRAADLAPRFDMDTPTFKRNIRRLKSQGLTQSLEVGYRVSERGEQVLQSIQDNPL